MVLSLVTGGWRLGGRVLRATSHQPLVVILLLPARQRDWVVDLLLLAPRAAPWRRFGGGVPAILAAADLALRVQPFEHEVDGRRDRRRGRAGHEARMLRELAQALNTARLRDHLV